MEEIKQVPYGVSDFVTVRERNLYYVDKTMYLSLLEQQPDNLFYIRPRRFGKSLFISMLQAYYDKAMTDRFDSLLMDVKLMLMIMRHEEKKKWKRYRLKNKFEE